MSTRGFFFARWLFIMTFAINGTIAFSQDSVATRIILVGDAGKQENNVQPELELIKKMFPPDKKTTVVFLGDNVYPQGLPSPYDKNYDKQRQILDSQINIVRGTEAHAYFIAGNHDWMQGGSGGYEQMLHQFRYIQSLNLDNVQYVPSDGCPGPMEIPISNKVTLVVIDSQWWLHRYTKPGVSYGCEAQTEDELLDALKEIVNRNENKLLIFADHHPFVTYGRHGGYYTIKQHIFPFTDINPKLYIPLPVIGSLYPISRGVFGNIQDTRHPIYRNFSSAVDSILNQHPYCIRVAGHEHNLQLIEKSKRFYIVSGAGSKTTPLAKAKDLLFGSASKTGFCVLDIIKNGNVNVGFYSSKNDTVENALFKMPLPPLDSTPPKPKVYTVTKFPDSVTVAANPNFKANKFKRWLLGANYRKEWMQPIRVPVFDMTKIKGGLTPTQKGGGLQTKSLRLQDSKKNEYVLRSVKKFPDNTLPEEFRETFVKDAVVDGISASYPYAAISIPALSDAARVPHSVPRIVYVPDDPRLGFYRGDFANSLCIFEEREPGGYAKNSSTEKVIEKLQDDNDNMVDEQAVLHARLLDMFIMDFDRHEDQWRWGTNDTGEKKIYYPIPRDRDQAFFINEGFIPKQIRAPYRLPKFQGFRAKAININTFNYNARYFDRSFLTGLSQQDWERQADTLIAQMTDEVIEKAIRAQPPNVFKYSGEKIIATLKERRKYLKKEAIQYFKFLAREVDIAGSDKREYFDVTRNDDGSVKVTIYKIKKEGDTGRKLYDRTFFKSETREVRLYGMGDSDSFHIKGDRGPIKIRIIGGRGKDYVINDAEAPKGKTMVYDFTPEENVITGNVKKELSTSTAVNRYDRRAFAYDKLIPGLAVAYNRDDGLLLGLGIRYFGQGFRKYPYKIMQQASAHKAIATKAFMFAYKLELIDAVGSSDLLVDANIRIPRNTVNFFGFGNETDYDVSDGKTIDFFRTRFDNVDGSAMLRAQITPEMTFSYGVGYHYFFPKAEDNQGKILMQPGISGIDTSTLFYTKHYLGPKAQILIDNRNETILPSRGVRWQTDIEYFKGIGKYTTNFTRLNSDLTVYISSNTPAKVVFAFRVGGGVNFGKYEYYQAQYLSGTQNLRGYRKFRFAGDKMLYSNAEVRYKIKEFRTYLLPGAFGLLAFYDVGRVWYKPEESKTWHSGYGAGIWLAPAMRMVATASFAYSKEGAMPVLTLGYQF